jgi:hypothetical protein
MTNKDGNQQRAVDFSDGISAGLKYWLFFLVCFLLLNYSVRLSIVLGAFGGLAAGWIVAWWKSKEQPKTQQQLDAAAASTTTGTAIKNRQRDTRAKNRRKGNSTLNPIAFLFKRIGSSKR